MRNKSPVEIYKFQKFSKGPLRRRTGKVVECLDFGCERTNPGSGDDVIKELGLWNTEDTFLDVYDEIVESQVCEQTRWCSFS